MVYVVSWSALVEIGRAHRDHGCDQGTKASQTPHDVVQDDLPCPVVGIRGIHSGDPPLLSNAC